MSGMYEETQISGTGLRIVYDDRTSAILIGDAENNDIAEFYHNEHATVNQSYETALRLAGRVVRSETLLKSLHNEINALGGIPCTEYERGINDTVSKVLAMLEREMDKK